MKNLKINVIYLLLICAIFIVSFSVRMGWVFRRDLIESHLREHGAKFGTEMERAALAVATKGTIRDLFSDDSGPSAHVSPAYAWALGTIYRISGPDRRVILRSQATFSCTVTAVAISLLPVVARRTRLRPGAGIGAALVMALVPTYFQGESIGSWEQPVAFLTLLLAFLASEARRSDQWRSWSGAIGWGILLGWSALLSPPVAMATFFMNASYMVAPDPGESGRIRRDLAVGVLITMVMLTPWTLRNHRTLGGLIPLRSNFGLELDLGNNGRADGYFDIGVFGRHPNASDLELQEYKRLGERLYMRAKMRSAIGWICHNPWRFIELTAVRWRIFWFPTRDFSRARGWRNPIAAVAMSDAYTCAVNLLAFGGLASLFRRNHPARWLYAAALTGCSLVYYVTQVSPRYRYPTYGICLLLAVDLLSACARRDIDSGGTRVS